MRFFNFAPLVGAATVLLSLVSTASSNDQAWTTQKVRSYLDAVNGSVVGGFVTPHWPTDESSSFWFSTRSTSGVEYFAVNASSSDVQSLFSDNTLRRVLDSKSDENLSVEDVDLGKREATVLYGRQKAVVSFDGEIRLIKKEKRSAEDLDDAKIVRKSFPIAAWDRREIASPDDKTFATLSGDNFGVRQRGNDKPVFLTQDGEPEAPWYFAGDIWENSETPWSPDGGKIVARLHDMRETPGIQIIDYLNVREELQTFRYWPRAGEPLPKTQFAVFNAATGKKTPARLRGATDMHDFFIGWEPNGRYYATLRYSRDLRKQTLFFIDAETGDAKKILTDTRRDGWVKWPSGPQTIVFLPSGNGFLFRSNTAGYFHWRLYDAGGKFINQVTSGAFDSLEIIGVDEDDGVVFFSAQSDPTHPYDVHFNRVGLDGSGQRQLTSSRGLHRIAASPDFHLFLDTHDHINRAPQTDLLNRDGETIATLAKAAVDTDFRADWPEPEEFVAKSADGARDVHGLIFKPHNFDPKKTYPVIERVYGGMQARATRRSFPGTGAGWSGGEYYLMLNYLNELGFIVITMDAPGTPGRGRAYNLATYGTWPEGVIADHAAAIKQVGQSRPYMDLARVGVEGNSWGGYIAGRAMIDAPDFYRAASMSVPETDLFDHVHWIEWQIGSPSSNKEHYEENALSNHASEFNGPLMIVAGTSDVNVPISNTMKFLDSLAEADKDYNLVIFPGTNHPHQGRGDRYAYAVKRIGAFFEENLKGSVARD
ncbi:MAG: prolyl oligopeptidase family serine peptidase [Pseudomonadota bacterium]